MSDDPYQAPKAPPAPPAAGQLAPGQERLLLILLTAVNFTQMMDFVVMMPLGPQLMKVFAITAQQFSVAVASYTFSAAISALIGSLFIDRFERKKALLSLYAGFALATLGCAFAPDFHTLVLARIAAGACGGLLGALVLAIVGDVIPYARRGAAMGQVMSAFAMASVLGVPTGIWLASWQGWHAAFVAIAVVAAIVLAIAVVALPTLRAHLAGPGRSPAAVLVALLRERAHWLALMFSTVLCLAGFTIIPFLATYLSRNLGVTDNQLPLVYLCGGLCGLVTQPWIGRMADRHGKHRVFIIAALLAMVPTLTLTHLQPPLPLAAILAVTTVFIILGSGRFVPASALITGAVVPSLRGSFMSLNSAVQSGASGLAAIIGGMIITQASPDAPLQRYGWVGWLSCLATLIAVALVGTLHARDTTPRTHGHAPTAPPPPAPVPASEVA
jgi:predicted MFS family arabinose efflux permease